MALNITLYNNKAEPEKVDKSEDLLNPLAMSNAEFLDTAQSITTPSILVSFTSIPSYNYCYMEVFNRYYYVVNKTWIGHNLWRLDLSEDVLYSHKNDILNTFASIEFSPLGSRQLFDPRLVYQTDTKVVEEEDYIRADEGYYAIQVLTPVEANALQSLYVTSDNKYMRIYFLTPSQYAAFVRNYWDGDAWVTDSLDFGDTEEKLRAYVNNLVYGIYKVDYFDAENTSLKTLDNYIPFVVPTQKRKYKPADVEITDFLEVKLSFNPSIAEVFPKSTCYYIETPYEQAEQDIEYRKNLSSDLVRYWEITSTIKIKIPYIGTLSFVPSDMGLNLFDKVSNIGFGVCTDYYGMTYTAYPIINYKPFKDKAITVPISKIVPFVKDNQITDWTSQFIQNVSQVAGVGLNIAGTAVGVGGLGKLAPTQAIGVADELVNLGGSILATHSSMAFREAIGFASDNTSKCGSSSDSLIVYKKVGEDTEKHYYHEILYRIYYKEPIDFVNHEYNYSLPDGHIRLLKDIADLLPEQKGKGFTSVGAIHMEYFTTATLEEIDEIKGLLRQGVLL